MYKELTSRYVKEYDYLPWRKKRSVYHTLVSEIMLQQTTVGTVLNHFDRFIKQFPTLKSLALATEEDVVIAWKGLGYYRRARNLRKACLFVYEECNGRIPKNYEELTNIPGIGDYTASAIIAMGRDEKALCVDANITRVMSRMFAIDEFSGPKLNKLIHKMFNDEKLVKLKTIKSYRAFNESIMDHGRTVCQKRSAKCDICILAKNCLSFKESDPYLFPKEKVKKTAKEELSLLRYFIVKDDHVFCIKKKEGEWLSGQHELPTFIVNTTDKNLKQYPLLKKKVPKSIDFEIKSGITKYKIINSVLVRKSEKGLEGEWVKLSKKNTLSSLTIKILNKLS